MLTGASKGIWNPDLNEVRKMTFFQFALIFVVGYCLLAATGVLKSGRFSFLKLPVILTIGAVVSLFGIIAKIIAIIVIAVLLIPLYLCICGAK